MGRIRNLLKRTVAHESILIIQEERMEEEWGREDNKMGGIFFVVANYSNTKNNLEIYVFIALYFNNLSKRQKGLAIAETSKI